MKVYNRTNLTIEEIAQLKVIMTVRSEWRQRNIRLLYHPTDMNRVISDGITFDQTIRVIADETFDDWKRELTSGKQHVTTH